MIVGKDYSPNLRNKSSRSIRELFLSSLKSLAATAAVVTVITGAGYLWARYNVFDLNEDDFNNARWIPYYNKNGRIHSCLDFESTGEKGVRLTSDNRAMYEIQVKKRNSNRLEGIIELPDLNGDGIVGKSD